MWFVRYMCCFFVMILCVVSVVVSSECIVLGFVIGLCV